ncbi:hypothetical protein EC396_10330 [Lutibacter sp. HS1-25]|uniref:hypothetical protein n=1 Tax=Lutibacter sp. HS1-25 TaxID=2485000 RepID=UPI0010130993|nr:hypothetical protein [Lutibacter sp. HS1-25]RXP53380.1 hypothetical protein EC396_10330 [Lutibacter sp. HS1-25]
MKVFIEEQKFNQPFVIIGLSMAFIVVGLTTYKGWSEISAGSIGEQIGALSGLIIILLVSLMFLFLKLKTRVDEIGVHYQFYPFHFSYKIITWNLIAKCYIRNYDAISEFGGWGLKFSFFGKTGKSFTTKGNTGLQIELKTGQKILIGTQKKEELQRTLDNYNYKI